MKLRLHNIGKVEVADIIIDGITVIAGPNNSGKSTIGKALYSLFNGLHDLDNNIRNLLVSNILQTLGIQPSRVAMSRTVEIVRDKQKLLKNHSLLRSIIKELVNTSVMVAHVFTEADLDLATNRILSSLALTSEELIKYLVNSKFLQEFSGQVTNYNFNGESNVVLTIKGHEINAVISNNEVSALYGTQSLSKEVVYIDNPFFMDEMATAEEYNSIVYPNHRAYLCKKILDALSMSSGDAVEMIKNRKKLESIYKKLSVCGGVVRRESSQVFFSDDYGHKINLKNLSAGLKTFVTIKTLLENNLLEENGTIILDEPEIHLHPEWQILFAEIIVLLQKEFGLHILLATHSPYFLEAIEVYSAKYGCSNTNYYLTQQLQNGNTKLENVNGNTNKIYELLANPFQELETIKNEL